MDAGAPASVEATLLTGDTFAVVDVLERLDDGFRLIEVKLPTHQKDERSLDVAV